MKAIQKSSEDTNTNTKDNDNDKDNDKDIDTDKWPENPTYAIFLKS